LKTRWKAMSALVIRLEMRREVSGTISLEVQPAETKVLTRKDGKWDGVNHVLTRWWNVLLDVSVLTARNAGSSWAMRRQLRGFHTA
jgi:hypothetical protein